MNDLETFLEKTTKMKKKVEIARERLEKLADELNSYKENEILRKIYSLNSFLKENNLWRLFNQKYDSNHNSHAFSNVTLENFISYGSKPTIEIQGRNFALFWQEEFRGETDYYSSGYFPLDILFDFEKLKDSLIAFEKKLKEEKEIKEKQDLEDKIKSLEEERIKLEQKAKELGL